jgi:DNA-binding protein YbaB
MVNYTEELLIRKFSKIKSLIDLLEFEEEIENNSFQFSAEDYHIIKTALKGKRKMMNVSMDSISVANSVAEMLKNN